ncbi:MAG: hypothetical protein GQ574_24660 [Crocinitomix sp.]|nr:hypothetical protein [Crocinitomix sp.]
MQHRTIFLVVILVLFYSCKDESSNSDSADLISEIETKNEKSELTTSDSLAFGIYLGALKSVNKPIVEVVFESNDSDYFQIPDTQVKKSFMRLMVTDSLVFWDPWLEHSGSYGTFIYTKEQEPTGFTFMHQESINVTPDHDGFIFHEELFQ